MVTDGFLVFGSKCHGNILEVLTIANCPFKELMLSFETHFRNLMGPNFLIRCG